MTTTQPAWARRMKRERDLRGWTQRECVRHLRYEAPRALPDDDMLLGMWKRWENGRTKPDVEYQRLIASLFGTVSGAMFVSPRHPREILASAATTEDTPDLLARIRASSVDQATLDALRLTVDRLCADYPSVAAQQLLVESRGWLARIGELLNHRVTLSQHRDVLSMAGMLALLVGCLEQDIGAGGRAESTRRSAFTLGSEADDHDIIGWAHEMSAWFSLTNGDYRGVLAAAESGIEAAGNRSVSVQLYAQQAKAWARVGDRSRVEVALDRGRRLLEDLPYPEDTAHHFVVDPAKYDFYAMDIYRQMGEADRANALADEVLERGTDWSGRELAPMRVAEANMTKGVVAAQAGDVATAATYGRLALGGDRKSVPSLFMVGSELGGVLSRLYPQSTETAEFTAELRDLASQHQTA